MSLGSGLGIHKIRFKKPIKTPLLDEVSGAAAGYSIRLLREQYSDGITRVRAYNPSTGTDEGEADVQDIRIGDYRYIDLNSPIENLDSKAQNRFNVSKGGGDKVLADLVNTDGNTPYDGYVSKWYEQSPNANHATNTTASEQPKLVSGGSLIKENGKPALFFDGNDDNNLLLSKDISTVTSSYSFHFVANANGNYIFDSENGRFIISIDDKGAFYDGSWRGQAYSDLEQILGELYLNKQNNSGSVYENDVNTSNTTYSPLTIQDKQRIGARGNTPAFFLDGKLQELNIRTNDIEGQRNTIKSNVNDFYNVF